MPGVLTAVAAIITATGGLIAVLVQGGFLGPGERRVSGSPAGASLVPTDTQPRQTPDPASSAATRPAISRSPAEVVKELRAQRFEGMVVTHTDGTVVSIQPTSSTHFSLTNGQTVAYDRIKRAEPQHPWNGRVRFTLVNGQQLDAQVSIRYFWGLNELGSYTGDLGKVEAIDFLREKR